MIHSLVSQRVAYCSFYFASALPSNGLCYWFTHTCTAMWLYERPPTPMSVQEILETQPWQNNLYVVHICLNLLKLSM